MRPAALVLFALTGALGFPVESRQDPGVLTEASEPAPIAAGRAPRPGEYTAAFDALHYDIHVTLPTAGSVIEGTTEIQFALSASAPDTLTLDLSGLLVSAVRVNRTASRFAHEAGKLLIPLPAAVTANRQNNAQSRGRRIRVAVDYRGTPDDGLIIRENVHGHRAAFADNWPNRARFWFPALDYPADKATASFTIVAPPAWEVIANGVRTRTPETIRMPDGTTRRRFSWTITEPISPYNMVIGAAAFRVERVGRPCSPNRRCVDVTTWLYPESAGSAAPSFRRAAQMVDYFSQLIAPFPYSKLAHVQSSTRFGGMENATAIFYDETALADGRNIESTVAHETAHQWFGDAVTESEWSHLWLSEGFADYFAALFFAHADGVAAFRRMMEDKRRQVIESDRVDVPIINPNEQDLFKLLNINNYAKAGWVLHMLRGSVGDDRFFDGIRRYYRGHEHGTATTADLQRAMEAASGTRLDEFFGQWLFHPGFPRFRVSSQWNPEQRMATVVIDQIQADTWPTFKVPLTIEFATASGTTRRRVDVDERQERYTFQLDSAPTAVVLDPDGWLLKDVSSQ
jgi:aminopeptidase N